MQTAVTDYSKSKQLLLFAFDALESQRAVTAYLKYKICFYGSCLQLTFSLPYMTEISVVIRQWT